MANPTDSKACLYEMNWTSKEAKIGPMIEPMPKAPVFIAETLDCSFYLQSSGSSWSATLLYSSSSVYSIAVVLLLFTNAAAMPVRPQPIHMMYNFLNTKPDYSMLSVTYWGSQGAGPVRI